VDPRAGLDDMEKLKFFTLPGLELPPPGRPAHACVEGSISRDESFEVKQSRVTIATNCQALKSVFSLNQGTSYNV
jgi:hypothetical protein